MTLPPGDAQSYELRPGDHLNFINDGPAALRIKVVTACGTETVAGLHPGARLELRAGTSTVTIYILGVDENYTGLRLVR